jgi:diguanylate cyclase (GGDEF)-like protein
LHDAVHDNLTGLPNRELFLDRLEAVLGFAKTDAAMRPTVMVIDLDRFKQVNDSVGMAVGDSILLTLARRLGRLIKPQDTLARLSGDQFGLLLLSERESARITALTETIRRTLRAPITFKDREIFLTGSIGMTLGDTEPRRGEEVLKDAELAMYHAKRGGGDRIDVFKPAMRARKTDRLSIESDLRRALERDEITILYQPIIRLEDRSVAGFEALARWNHPKLGRMSNSACSCSIAPRDSSAPGSGRYANAHRFSPASTSRRANCCVTISYRTCAPCWRARRSRADRSSSNSPNRW